MDINHSTNPTSGRPPRLLWLREADVKCSKVFLQELEEKQLLQQVCNIWVETGGFRMVGFAYADGREMIGPMLYANNRHEISATDNPSSDRLVLQEVSTIAIRTGQTSRNGDVLSLPVRENERLFGALTMRASQANEFGPNTIELLDASAKFLARALAGLQTRRQRKEIEDALKRKESGIRQLIDAIPQHILINAPTGVPLFANKAWVDYHGQSLEALQSLGSALDSVHPDDVDRLIVETSQGYSGKTPFQTEFRVRRKDGQFRWFLFRLNPLEDQQGNIIRWYSAATDIEDLKNAEARLRLVVDTTPAMIHTARPDGYLDYFNQRWLDYLGMRLDDLQGWAWTQVVHPSDVDNFLRKWRASIASGTPFEAEARVRRADGEYRTLIHRKFPMRDEGGNILKWYGSSLDIEDRKHAEEKIRAQEIELRQILDAAPQHLAVLGPDGSRLYLNQAALEYHGLTLEQWHSCALPALFHPDDWELTNREVQIALSAGTPLEIEARVVRHDGKYRWFIFRYKPLRDEQGHITRWAVAAIDIDERKQTEERLHHENVALREEIDKASMFEEIVGSSPTLQAVLTRVSKVAPTDSTVLITGETGTGKELIARAIHRRSLRSSRAFVSVNCAAIPRDLIASELFGHEKGSFTGATQERVGRFELASGGTIFLDEVGELPVETQIALLRVLQEHEFERVGGTRSIRTDVRVIAATNRDLSAAIATGTFRSDLFYRLNVFPIEIPPLRQRREDIPLLVEYFIDRFARKAGKPISGLNKNSLALLQSYPWPGNIRELQNVIERSVILCDSENFSVDQSWLSPQPRPAEPKRPLDLSEKLAAQEKEMIEAALAECGGRVYGPSGAAAKLGMARSTLESKIRSLKINKHRFKT